MSLTTDTLNYALSLGFDRVAVMPASPPRYGTRFSAWLAAGYFGEMNYMARRAAERLDPKRLAPNAASTIMLAMNYNPGPSAQHLADPSQGRIARYAWWPDYHDALKPKLYLLDAFIRARTGRETPGKVFVDSSPVLERDFAEQAGLGFIGRNTCLITPGLGSWTFLAGLLVPETLAEGRHQGTSRDWRLGIDPGCGRCTRCLDACPTRAFVEPHVLDARRCISYLTIELRGAIPHDLRPLMGNWVFGCDVCQLVCPYNRLNRVRAQTWGGGNLPLSEILALDEAGFRARFRGTSVLRTKRAGLLRNACVAAGNSGDPSLAPALVALLADLTPLVRDHAAWALDRLGAG